MSHTDGQIGLRQLLCESLANQCPHCGKDTREKWFGYWPAGGQPISACCEQQLITNHGADPKSITKQSLRGLFGADPIRMLRSIRTALTR